MSKILVPPTVLLAVSDQFAKASDHLEMTKNTLNQQISMMMFTWDGTTRQRFFVDFQGARSEMKLTIEHMRVISQELKDIAYKFLAVDSETGELDPRCMAPVIPAPGSGSGVVDDGPKTWGDHAEELWKGAQSGAKILADSITGTVDALIEDPLGTGGQLAYDATIGMVEEVIDTAVWGAKMTFDIGDTREQFDEKMSAEQDKINQMGMSGYLGEMGTLFFGGVALRRVGVKNRHGVKSDAGKKDKRERTREVQNPLPNLESAKIDPRKLTEYALNPEHPVGGNKAKVFNSALGYNKSNADDLMKQVQKKLPQSEAVLGKVDQYGQRFTVDMLIAGPNGNKTTVRTGWIIKPGSDTPEMTTIYVK